jgi:ribosomal protein L37AE/L43A
MPGKCEHDIYGDGWGCQQCNPAPPIGGATPILPRSSSDPLNSTKTDETETCPCGCIRTYSQGKCLACGLVYEISDNNSRQQGAANSTQTGVCPTCGSNIHYELKKSLWKCADCDTEYKAPARIRKAAHNVGA